MVVSNTVAVPVFNEELSLQQLLDALLNDVGILQIIAVDDQSTDRSSEILEKLQSSNPKLTAHKQAKRSGQLAAWITAAKMCSSEFITFIDADAVPSNGAIGKLVQPMLDDPKLMIVSGRVVPDETSRRWPAARFRASIVHRIRMSQRPQCTIIGRFFAVRRDWFLQVAVETQIIANDAFLAVRARQEGYKSKYVPDAECFYCEAGSTLDFAAQRQRADAGFLQLRARGMMTRADEVGLIRYLVSFIACAARDPFGALSWSREQLKSRRIKAYVSPTGVAGAWETQSTTKRPIG